MLLLVETGLVLLVLALFSAISLYKKLLDVSGVILSIAVGAVSYWKGGFTAFFVLVVIYVIAQLATKVAKSRGNVHEQRGFGNIFGNTVPAVIALFFGNMGAFFGAVSSALADTVASEVGFLSKQKPVMITTLRPVERGTDGGVSALGFASAIVASLLLGLVYYFAVQQSLKAMMVVIFCGMLGTVLDSILGATLQHRKLVDNNQVNFIANLASGIAAFLLLGPALVI